MIRSYLEYSYTFDREISRETFLYLTDFHVCICYINKSDPHRVGLLLSQMVHIVKESVSGLMDFFLQPFVSTTKSYIKDTNDVLIEIEGTR